MILNKLLIKEAWTFFYLFLSNKYELCVVLEFKGLSFPQFAFYMWQKANENFSNK